eukprot:TRINITY_DN3869_c0_g1_i1.p1 TRINITY_DN3869_c0_g1~~TRINITY_DN3869_c0_g1_i1.p1  ORF type:complete len:297 (+),score=58.10 TRINITY_DN3869_c0_g1_i1:62-952(+)
MAVPAVLVSLCVVRQGERFMSVHEHDGWYLPAGRVDFGETFATGAVRETLEEAGIPVKLDGILRIQHTGSPSYHRLRVIYLASPTDNTPPKSVADHETIEAKWVTVQELRQRELRAREVFDIFSWTERGATVYPMQHVQGQDCATINHQKCECCLRAVVTLIVRNTATNLYLVVPEHQLPRGEMSESCNNVPGLANEILNSLNCGSGEVAVEPQLSFLALVHHPPAKRGEIAVVDFVLVSTVATAELRGEWVSAQQLRERLSASGHDHMRLVGDFVDGVLLPAPMTILTHEHAPYQ